MGSYTLLDTLGNLQLVDFLALGSATVAISAALALWFRRARTERDA